MKTFTFCYFSSSGLELPSLGMAVTSYRQSGKNIKIIARTSTQLFDNSRIKAFVKDAMEADVVFINIHGGKSMCPVFDPVIDEINRFRSIGEKTPYLHLQPAGGDDESQLLAAKHSDGLENGHWSSICKYYARGSVENLTSIFHYFYNMFFDKNAPVPVLREAVQEGLYHPSGKGCKSIDEYIKVHVKTDRPTVGIWFGQYYWVNGNLAHIDALITEIEKRDANAIAVFSLRFKDNNRGNLGADEVVNKFFKINGKPVIDVLISTIGFAMSVTNPEFSKVLPDLGVVVLQGICTSQPYSVWKESIQGISTMDVSTQAAQPEFDGNLITVPFSTREQDTIDSVTGGLLVRMMPVTDRVEKLVSLSLNWANLRRKSNANKKIAIVFHHYPPRNDRIGCAAGLDSFASVNELLKRMKTDGYLVERTFENGDELASEILERMTTDRRWMTPEKMARRAEAFAESDQYIQWHASLPPTIRHTMIEKWGDMPGDLIVQDRKLLFLVL